MSDLPDDPDGPGDQPQGPDDVPEQLRRMLEQMLGGQAQPGAEDAPDLSALLGGGGAQGGPLGALLGGGGSTQGPVDWRLARRAALASLGDGDRSPDEDHREAVTRALELAEHWLDQTDLPAAADAGRLLVTSRKDWLDGALAAMRPVVEPVAAASTEAMAELAEEQLGQLGEGGLAEQLEQLGLGSMAPMLAGFDAGAMLRPVGASLAGLQAGQVLGELAGDLLTGYELGLPTGPRSTAVFVAPNIDDAFDGWDLDRTEVLVVLALHEAAQRRLWHAVPWLEGHVHELVATFAEAAELDPQRLQGMAEGMLGGVDPSDPDALREAMAQAGQLQMEPTAAQRRVLERCQGVVALVGAWARRAVAEAAEDRLPSRAAVDEVLRRRRATRGAGEQQLAQLLGLDLVPDDPSLGDAFVAHVVEELGSEGLRTAVAHPENLPDLAELAEPAAWLARVGGGEGSSDVPDDVASLLDGLGDAPVERSADERLADGPEADGDEPGSSPDDGAPSA